MTSESTSRLISDEMIRLMELVEGADSVELKMTVPEIAQRSTVAALGLDPLDAQIRQVFFFDTPDLALYQAGVVARPSDSGPRERFGGQAAAGRACRPPRDHASLAGLRRRGGCDARRLRVLRLAEGQAAG